MKKILVILLALLALAACTSEKVAPEPDKPEIESRLLDISPEELQEKEKDCKYFVLYVYKDGCPDCANFNGILEKYLNNNNAYFYRMEEKTFKDLESIAHDYLAKAPFLAIISNGEVLSYLDNSSEETKKYYNSLAGFNDWMKDKTEEYCLKPIEDKTYCSPVGC